ncbi:hypothetical protein Syun_023674 [Stephania yunnanensis]|uniref:non-specific serine/threonine protein kinase n=1 Tax=Stephania yunnanensis TaxID=152371 RepID=A0AAP0FNK8_9MAGN
MSNLSQFYGHENRIGGWIPEELWQLTQIKELDLSSNNNLSGNLSVLLSRNIIDCPFFPDAYSGHAIEGLTVGYRSHQGNSVTTNVFRQSRIFRILAHLTEAMSTEGSPKIDHNCEVVALKKFRRWEQENLAFERSFINEIQVLTKVRHRNIAKLYGFCCHTQCAFLVYEYLEKGSLFVALAEHVEAPELNGSKRFNIIKGISCALSYLHHDCNPPIIHWDISSNNILLDSEYEAHAADFGIA